MQVDDNLLLPNILVCILSQYLLYYINSVTILHDSCTVWNGMELSIESRLCINLM